MAPRPEDEIEGLIADPENLDWENPDQGDGARWNPLAIEDE
jgi:hypothetical protein